MSIPSETKSIPVLIVGGSLAGLSAAIFLGTYKVPTILIECHPGSSDHPRALGYTPRTMELYRSVGLGDQIPQVPADFKLRRTRVESLAGKWFDDVAWTKPDAKPQGAAIESASTTKPAVIEYSPCRGAALAQDELEAVLRKKAIELGVDIRLRNKLLSFDQDGEGVNAVIQDPKGHEYTLRAQYVVAADGHRSPIREKLGINREGVGHLNTVRSVLFRAPLDHYLESGVTQFSIVQPGFEPMLTTYHDGRWCLFLTDDVDRSPDELKSAIYKAVGKDDFNIDVITTGRWEMAGLIAQRFSVGRIFLVGDAAHTLPPNRGGYGANTGIEDTHNLAWKLSQVLSGASTTALLDTYDAERRPIALLRHDQIFARADYKVHVKAELKKDVALINDNAMELGQLYRSDAVIGADEKLHLPAADLPDKWAGQPGTRAPHIRVTQNDKVLSLLDLFQQKWVLLAEDEKWSYLLAEAKKELPLKLKGIQIGHDVQVTDPQEFRTAFGVSSTGASLIRPDGYVAWRSVDIPADPLSSLVQALRQVSFAVLKT